jgi:hypothetical protein
MSIATLHCNPQCVDNEGVDEKVKQELADLEAIAQRIVRRNAANKADEEEIRRRLPGLRKQGVGPAALERTIHSVFVAGTISRWTVEAAGTGKKNRAGESPPDTPEPPGDRTPDGT